MSITSITGLGTGLDIDSIVTAMVAAERSPKENQITNQRASTNTTLSAVGTLQSALDSFQTSLASLNKATSFAGLSATSSNTEAVAVTSDSTAVGGSYQIEVKSLATGSKVASAAVSGGASTTFSKGVITISQGSDSYPVNIEEGASLQDIRDAINTRYQSAGLSANVVTDSSGNTRLVLGSTKTGAGNDLTVTGVNSNTATGANADLSAFDIRADQSLSADGAGYITAKAQDAVFTVDGLELTSASNTVENAVSGLSFSLASEGTSTVKVSTNSDGLKGSLQSFVMAYNTLIAVTSGLTKVSTTTSDSGTETTAAALTGDSTVRTLLNSIRSELVSGSGDSGGISLLSQLGINTKQDGTLEIDDTKLDKAITANYSSIASFFTGDSGLLNRLSDKVDVYTETGGLLEQRQTNLKSKLTDLTSQEDALDRRITKLEATLYSKYNAMDSLVAQLNATSESILTTLNALNNNDD